MQTLSSKTTQNNSLTSCKCGTPVAEDPVIRPRCLASLPANIDELIAIFQKQGTQATDKDHKFKSNIKIAL